MTLRELRKYLNEPHFPMNVNSGLEILLVSGMLTSCPLSILQKLYCCRDFEGVTPDVTGYVCVQFAKVF